MVARGQIECTGMGGAIFNGAGTVSLTNVALAANAENGGTNGYTQAGNGSGNGGAIFNYAGSLTLDFVTASGNTVAAGTGGMDAGVAWVVADRVCVAFHCEQDDRYSQITLVKGLPSSRRSF